MAAEISTESFAAVLLYLAEGDPGLDLGEMLARVEAWQERTNRYFGTSAYDVQGAIRELAWESSHALLREEQLEELYARTTLGDWLPVILSYRSVYFNDEGESWLPEVVPHAETQGGCDMPCYNGLPLEDRTKLIELLVRSRPPDPLSLLESLRRLGLGPTILLSCSQPENSSE
jgi:hypothetical protein